MGNSGQENNEHEPGERPRGSLYWDDLELREIPAMGNPITRHGINEKVKVLETEYEALQQVLQEVETDSLDETLISRQKIILTLSRKIKETLQEKKKEIKNLLLLMNS